MSELHKRDDIFVSICFSTFEINSTNVLSLDALAHKLSASYRYWEIIIAVSADVVAINEQQLLKIPNLRLLIVRKGVPFYRRRLVVTSEAIGDVVGITAIGELSSVNLVDLIQTAVIKQTIIVARAKRRNLANPLLKTLGRAAGFRVDGRDLQTSIYPRALLNRLLAHSDRQLALRFPPADAGIPVIWKLCAGPGSRRNTFYETARRIGLLQNLLVSSASRVLSYIAVTSILVILGSFLFILYAFCVMFFVKDMQEGWFSTSILLSLIAAFLGSAMLGMSIGLQKVIDLVSDDVMDDITDERSSVDLFKQVTNELNVEIGGDDAISSMVSGSKPQ